MKKIYLSIAVITLLLGASSCDKDFEEINTNPNATSNLDAGYLFSSAQQGSVQQTHLYQAQIVQQVVTHQTGTLEGGNHNVINEVNTRNNFNSLYGGPIRNLVDVIDKTATDPARSNLYNMARIMKAYNFMILVDTYGDVPYFDAGKANIEGADSFLPKYDDQKLIYEDIIKELQEATDQLDASKDKVPGDLFYLGDIPKWKKLGNSLLLRVGMRYTELDESKAKAIVADAVSKGVMTSNADNAIIRLTSAYPNATSQQLTATEASNFYVGKPFADYLKATNDPRTRYFAARYNSGSEVPETPQNLNGMPYGYTVSDIATAPGYTGNINGYSQFRRSTVIFSTAPEHFVTYSQTQLLMAEAAIRGYIASPLEAVNYYTTGIKAHFDQMKDYSAAVTFTNEEIDAYLAQPALVLNPLDSEDALRKINEQYWVASFRNWSEAWANLRRSGYPVLPVNRYPSADASLTDPKYNAQGFIRRLIYPQKELSVNTNNINEAITRMGGNTLGTRIFWDKN